MLDDKDAFEAKMLHLNSSPEVRVSIYRDNVWKFIDGEYLDEQQMKYYGAKPPLTKAKCFRMAGRYLILSAHVIDEDLRRVTHA